MNYQSDMAKFTYFVDKQLGILADDADKFLGGVGVRNQPVAGSRALAIRLDPRAEGALPLVAKALKQGQ